MSIFKYQNGLQLLSQLLGVKDLRPFNLSSSIISASASLIHYIQNVALIDTQHINTVSRYSTIGFMTVDPATMKKP